jgi:hypothetical protein
LFRSGGRIEAPQRHQLCVTENLVANVRFGSFATDAFRAGAEQCPVCLQ